MHILKYMYTYVHVYYLILFLTYVYVRICTYVMYYLMLFPTCVHTCLNTCSKCIVSIFLFYCLTAAKSTAIFIHTNPTEPGPLARFSVDSKAESCEFQFNVSVQNTYSLCNICRCTVLSVKN